MDAILTGLRSGARVLDLAAQRGSFDAKRYPVHTCRVDLDPPAPVDGAFSLRADAARLPFPDGCFDALICNHGLEHFGRLEAAIAEMGRVVRSGGVLFLTVPDAGTFTDRLYRFLARGGGHVNAFRSPREVERIVSRITGLPSRGRRTLYTSLSFVHPANRGPRRNRRLILLCGAGERTLRWATWLFRILDRRLGTRLAIYGWAFYFGGVGQVASAAPWTNACVRCGAGHPSERLRADGAVKPGWAPGYACPACGTWNLWSDDERFTGRE